MDNKEKQDKKVEERISIKEVNVIPPAVYSLEQLSFDSSIKKGFSKAVSEDYYYLKFISATIKLPEKIYGKNPKILKHYMRRFDSNNESLEVLLIGDAGSGKTLLSDMICAECLKRGMPVIDISSSTSIDEDGIRFLENKFSNVCIRIDEFGKVISCYQQNKLLTLLTRRDRRIFWILTENSYYDINRFFIGATHRVRYAQEFDKLEAEAVVGYCADNQVDEKFLKQILDVRERSDHFSFTHLVTLVEEHKLFPELTLDEIISFLNLKHLSSIYKVCIVSFKIAGMELLETIKSSLKSSLTLMDFDFKSGSTSNTNSSIPNRGGGLMRHSDTSKANNEDKDKFAVEGTYSYIKKILEDTTPFRVRIRMHILGDRRPAKLKREEEPIKDLDKSKYQNLNKMVKELQNSKDEVDVSGLKNIRYEDLVEFLKALETRVGEYALPDLNGVDLDSVSDLRSTKDNPLVLANDYFEIKLRIEDSKGCEVETSDFV